MGYNTHLVRAGLIPTRNRSSGLEIAEVIMPGPDERVTLPYIRIRTGPVGGNLVLFQPVAITHITQLTTGKTLSIPDISLTSFPCHAVIQYDDGSVQLNRITAGTAGVYTFRDDVKPTVKAKLYIFGSEYGPPTVVYKLADASLNVLEAPCPGVFVAKEKGWPVLLFLQNTQGDQDLEMATVAFINV